MTFSQKVKAELCALPLEKPCCLTAECYGAMLFANVFRADELRIITGSETVAQRMTALARAGFGLDLAQEKRREKGRFVLKTQDTTALFHVFNALGHDPDAASMALSRTALEKPCCRASFLRGAFLTGGAAADPEKRYHLEFTTPYRGLSAAFAAFLEEMDLAPRVTMRAGQYLVYFKRSETIEDLLVTIGAQKCALEVMQSKVVKEVRNNVNRYVNCETANITKTIEAAQTQVQAIRRLADTGRLAALPEALRETAELRLENPEASLSALGQLLSPPVGRATLNYRLKKLVELSREEKEEQA